MCRPDDYPPYDDDGFLGPCRHCARFIHYVDARWLDVEDGPQCRPGLDHQPMPDPADMALDIAQALDPEAFR
jgi:hypothetical protein